MELPLEDVVVQFTIVVSIAFVIQFSLAHSRVPAIIGLLLAGMLLGEGGIGLLGEEPVGLLGSIGLLFIMFMAGLEIDLDVVRAHKRETITFGTSAAVFSLALAVGVGLLLGLPWMGALLVAAALTSHTLVAYPIVERLGIVRRKPMVAAIGGTLLTDTIALVLLAILVQQPGGAASGAEGGGAAEGGGFGWMLPLLLLAALAVSAIAVIPRVAARVLDDSRVSLAHKALFLLVVLLGLATAADAIGTEDILGAFLAGLCVNQALKIRPALHDHVQFVGRMLFIPFFFVETGMRLDLAVFGQGTTWGFALAFLAVVVTGKSAAAILTGRMFGYGRMDIAAMIGLTIPQAAATLAVIVIGREMDLISAAVEDAIIIVIFLTCLIGPLVSGYTGRRLSARPDEQSLPERDKPDAPMQRPPGSR